MPMPTYVWLLMWAIALGVLAFFVVRELRGGRKGPADVDRYSHPATREAAGRAGVHGPGGTPQTWLG